MWFNDSLKTKEEVKAAIYNMSAGILTGAITEKEIEKVTKVAKKFDLLWLVKQELKSNEAFMKK